MDAYVVKVQYEDSLRRLPLEGGDLAFSFAQLAVRTKDLFQIPPTAQLIFTYTDRDGDVVTMAEDQDLRDALVTQALNPLRLNLAVVSGETGTTDVKMNDSPVEQRHEPNSETGRAPETPEDKNITETNNAKDKDVAAKAITSGQEAPSSAEQAVHKGITCDDCGMTPITGPRYKSVTSVDYDLCQHCFDKPEVDASEYMKIKRGRPDRRSVHFGGRGFGHGPRSERGRHRRGDMDGKGCSGRPCEHGRRERPSGGKMVHHGVECDECKTSPIVGARYKSEKRFNYDLCQNCFQKVASSSNSDEYTRIDQPVRYMPRYYHFVSPFSFYRFSPYGRPFGGRRIRRIMVTTVSDEEEKEQRRAQKGADAAPGAAAEQPPAASTDVKMGENDGQNGAQANSRQAAEHRPEAVTKAGEVTMTEAAEQDNRDKTLPEKVIEERQQVGTGAATTGTPGEQVLTHADMVSKLAGMGFSDSKLNEELLKKNNFDLRTTLDDLCAVKNWNPMLEELSDMGFSDSELNKTLLAQYDGNVRIVVRELVRLTKEQTKTSAN